MKNRKKLVSLLAGIMAGVLILSLILSIIPAASAASSSEIRKQINELEAQQEELQAQKEELKNQYEETEDEIANLVAEKYVIDQEITILYAQIDLVNEQVAAYGLLIADKQDELDEAEEHLSELTAKNRQRIRTMEEEGSLSYWAVLFQANSFSDLLDRLNMVEEIAASDQRRLKEMSEAAQVVAAARDELAGEKAELEGTQQELLLMQEELDEKRAEADAIIQELLEKCEEIEGLYEELETEDEALMNEIAEMEKAYNQAKHDEWVAYMATYTTVPPATTAPATTESSSGNGTGTNNGTGASESTGSSGSSGSSSPSSSATWLVPCSYVYVSSPFGNRDQPTAGASTNHQGVDLAAPAGTPIYATRSGVVTIARSSQSAGNYVTINHGDGFSSVYMHMTNYVVSVNQAVSQGQLIGYVGSTGYSTGNHLHFGIAYNGTYVNPALYVNLS